MEDAHHEAQELAEHYNNAVYTPSTGVNFSTGYATLKIDMSLLTKEQRYMVYEAEKLLRSARVIFDVNSGKGFRNWELDWSLSGAIVETRSIVCSALTCETLTVDPRWACYFIPTGRVVSYAYCSASHRERDIERTRELGWECLIKL